MGVGMAKGLHEEDNVVMDAGAGVDDEMKRGWEISSTTEFTSAT